jgi:hypothetical protein
MATEEAGAAGKRESWNPFQKLESQAESLSAAKSGAVVGGFLILSYLVQIASVYWGGKDTFGNVGLPTLISDILGVVSAAFLTWRILVRQPLWASIVVGAWFALELAMKIAAIASGMQRTNVGYVFMFAAMTAAAVLSVRGSWKLRALRRSAD